MAEVTFKFNESEVTFNFDSDSLKVNATQMAKIYGKYPKDFLVLDSTKSFIEECLKKENSPNLNIKSEEDLVTSKQQTGTWLHRVLALKFAAWLNPAFELWVYSTIDKIIFGEFQHLKKSLKESANRKVQIETLREQLREDAKFQSLEMLELEERQAAYGRAKFQSLEMLELEERQAAYGRGKFNNSQIRLFREPVENA